MNCQSVGISSHCPEVFLELFPINFWILQFKILIPTVEIYNRNSTRVSSSHISHFVLIPTYVGPNASPLGTILYTWGRTEKLSYSAPQSCRNTILLPRFWETEFSEIDWIQSVVIPTANRNNSLKKTFFEILKLVRNCIFSVESKSGSDKFLFLSYRGDIFKLIE